MPVYLCQSGVEGTEPWRYGIQVYSSPFPIDSTKTTDSGGRDLVIATSWSAAGREGQQPEVATGQGHPIRRVRHAEVVLVDDVCVAYERYWLRLRWPGNKGGFAGYIAMGLVSETPPKSEFNSIIILSFPQKFDLQILSPLFCFTSNRPVTFSTY